MTSLNDARFIGRVRHVLGATVTVELDPDLAGVAPVWEGRLQPVGQVGSIVRIPQGPVTLLASVTLVGIAELTGPLSPSSVPTAGNRWLQVQLLGEIDGLGKFQRGVGSYPGLDDPVAFVTAAELRAVFPLPNDEWVRIGRIASSGDIPATVRAATLVVRHGAIVGSTGAGKSSAVSLLLQRFAAQWRGANVVVIDPHGEYGAALGAVASVRSVLGSGDSLLRVPYWALPADDILRAFADTPEGPNTGPRFQQLVLEARRAFASKAAWVDLPAQAIGPDTPVPFDLRQVWFSLDAENNATYPKGGNEGDPEIEVLGNAQTLIANTYKPYGAGSTPPIKGKEYGTYRGTPDRIRLRILDPRFGFLQNPLVSDSEGSDPLVGIIDEWLGSEKPVSVLDFSGVPAAVADMAIGLVIQVIFEVALRGRADGIGRKRPVLIVLEEAHRYLGDGATVRTARDAVNRVAREGRKYGVGLLLVTQRPSELPATALSQVGTIMALRLTNAGDQSTVRSALPDSVGGLAEALPSLRTGEAIVAGEGITLPARVALDPPSPWPSAGDPSLDGWVTSQGPNDVAAAVARWRGKDA